MGPTGWVRDHGSGDDAAPSPRAPSLAHQYRPSSRDRYDNLLLFLQPGQKSKAKAKSYRRPLLDSEVV
jgi:hypothetical protein